MKLPVKLKILDIVIIGLALALTVGFSFAVYVPSGSRISFLIEAPERNWTYPSDAEIIVQAEGAVGITVIEIREGKAWVASSPCENQSCVAAGSISRNGQWIACLPNQVFVYIEGKEESDDNSVDGATW
jgi:hypothetical protein